ncbi:uncharacterized protein ARB_01749 [Trichophyton benhamiae CBS 112371]|uniref:Uncharacterized protein n=1 Tax=Arthroderma benhamiae (strain ATCC MYA-4681 / CBS 112371) TaxID=663331 RepID=D4AZX9_ARTBC|nr:uncharacterized protein ARB_01749 [Trichophyton benhamiae CBS 112371]EFE31354.1 hypothetical protein ARB_01749 [Trichophyton benhamiae CBS 112371]
MTAAANALFTSASMLLSSSTPGSGWDAGMLGCGQGLLTGTDRIVRSIVLPFLLSPFYPVSLFFFSFFSFFSSIFFFSYIISSSSSPLLLHLDIVFYLVLAVHSPSSMWVLPLPYLTTQKSPKKSPSKTGSSLFLSFLLLLLFSAAFSSFSSAFFSLAFNFDLQPAIFNFSSSSSSPLLPLLPLPLQPNPPPPPLLLLRRRGSRWLQLAVAVRSLHPSTETCAFFYLSLSSVSIAVAWRNTQTGSRAGEKEPLFISHLLDLAKPSLSIYEAEGLGWNEQVERPKRLSGSSLILPSLPSSSWNSYISLFVRLYSLSLSLYLSFSRFILQP